MTTLVGETKKGQESERSKRAWWKHAVVYQIYPSSFNDSNGDGIGDIPGIIEKLDYLKKLGIDVLWLSPIYCSPMKDMGYDISDYRRVDPRYGTLEDVETLVKEARKRSIKIVMDLVVNHSSDEHGWFKESRKSKTNPKRDYYIWRQPKFDAKGKRLPPNNWVSVFGGSAWTYDETTGEYYLHLFTSSQPDLNWESPVLRREVYSIMSFWLERRIAGFRMDVINLISKTPELPDAPVTDPKEECQDGSMYFANGPRLHEFLQEMRREVLDKFDTITIGEMPFVTDPQEVLKCVKGRRELDMVFQFDIVEVDSVPGQKKFYPHRWKLADLKAVVDKWQTFMINNDGWNAVYDENHDQPRSVFRYVDRSVVERSFQAREMAAKMLATFLVLQSGTLFLYQGQEIGMGNVPREWGIEEYKDVEGLNFWNKLLEEREGDLSKMKDAMEALQSKARDNARTPVQWDSSPQAGFTTGSPWMRVNDDYEEWNVAAQIDSPSSVYNYYTKLLGLRRDHKNIIVYGGFEMLSHSHEKVFAYKRYGYHGPDVGKAAVVVVMNFTGEAEVEWDLKEGKFGKEGLLQKPEVIIGTYGDGKVTVKDGIVRLRPFEAVVFWGDFVDFSRGGGQGPNCVVS
ncbi:unnamed protein product [Tuber melanosporum]|uniref:(Perigord truffle) hypothetical protein n=1 Tax=Tuber melanosporum (strain Mel28) TaxID=656061 RepID=D5GHN4_TUBMM|nr:uncharacterized protein GSTUM_00008058001 [Tuber melanosporum]CAZ84064.1 unnamed protein product [Tuber melanosporum]